MSMKRYYLSTAAGFAAVLAASSASAATVPYNLVNPIGAIGTYAQQTDIISSNSISNLLFPKFNNVSGIYAGATLNWMFIELLYDYRANILLTNTNNVASTGTANTSVQAKLPIPSGFTTQTNATQVGASPLPATQG